MPKLRRRWAKARALTLVAVVGMGCKHPKPAAQPSGVTLTNGPRPAFEYTTLDGKALTTETIAGRISVIGFAATYDVASQAEARFLANVARKQTPRVNVALLVLEPPENLPLVEAFAKTLDLPYPVALADAATIAGTGPFSGLHHVPSIVVLDAEGRERWRHMGLVTDKELQLVIAEVARPPTAPAPGAGDGG